MDARNEVVLGHGMGRRAAKLTEVHVHSGERQTAHPAENGPIVESNERNVLRNAEPARFQLIPGTSGDLVIPAYDGINGVVSIEKPGGPFPPPWLSPVAPQGIVPNKFKTSSIEGHPGALDAVSRRAGCSRAGDVR